MHVPKAIFSLLLCLCLAPSSVRAAAQNSGPVQLALSLRAELNAVLPAAPSSPDGGRVDVAAVLPRLRDNILAPARSRDRVAAGLTLVELWKRPERLEQLKTYIAAAESAEHPGLAGRTLKDLEFWAAIPSQSSFGRAAVLQGITALEQEIAAHTPIDALAFGRRLEALFDGGLSYPRVLTGLPSPNDPAAVPGRASALEAGRLSPSAPTVDGKKLLDQINFKEKILARRDVLIALARTDQKEFLAELLSSLSGFDLRAATEYKKVKKALTEGPGFAILTGLPMDGLAREDIDLLYTAVATMFGDITLHGGKNKLVWEVTPNQEVGERQRTFSELPYEAPLHTDSSFLRRPEDYFALLALREAEDGGNSIVIPIRQVLKELAREARGPAVIKTLKQPFPFELHAAYDSQAGLPNAVRVITAPILEKGPKIRYRFDSIEAGLHHRPDLATPERVAALHYFDAFIRRFLNSNQAGLRLRRGDMLIGNNRTVLHARTAFLDPNRLLLRVRMTERSSTPSLQ